MTIPGKQLTFKKSGGNKLILILLVCSVLLAVVAVKYRFTARQCFMYAMFDTKEDRRRKKRDYFHNLRTAPNRKTRDILVDRQWWYWHYRKKSKIYVITALALLLAALVIRYF